MCACLTNPQQPKPNLSPREIEVLVGWLSGVSKHELAADLYLALGTVNTHLSRVRNKYAAVGRPAPTKSDLLVRALQDGLMSMDAFA